MGIYKILTVPVFGVLYCYTAIGVIFGLILTGLNAKKPLNYIFRYWSKSVFIFMGKRLSVTGKENLNRNEKYLVLANHSSLFDIIAITSIYPEVSWFGHERLLKIPVFGKFLRMMDYVPFREPTVTNTREMLRNLVDKSDQKSIALFPEGTRTLDGGINPFYRGFIYLLRTKDVDILPLTLNGFYELKPKNRFYIDFGAKLNIVIHRPIPREELISRCDSEIIDSVKTVIESAYQR